MSGRIESALRQLGASRELGVAAEHDVRAASGHVRGDGDARPCAGLGDDCRLALVVLRVEDLVRNAAPLEQRRQVLDFHAYRANQHRLTLAVAFDDVVRRQRQTCVDGAVNEVGLVGRIIGMFVGIGITPSL